MKVPLANLIFIFIRGFIMKSRKKPDAKEILGHLPDTIYLSRADSIPPVISSKLVSIADLTRKGSGKMDGKFSILFCDYSRENVSGIMDALGIECRYVQLPMLSQAFFLGTTESYFMGYEGIADKILESAKNIEKKNRREKLVYSRSFFRLFEKYYIIFRNMVSEHGIKAFFLTGLVGICEAAILKLSIDRNIKVFCCQHGSYDKIWPDKRLLKNTTFFASGLEERKVLLRNGIKQKNIIITGSPFFDMAAKYRKPRYKSPGKKITILTQQYVECGMIGKREYLSVIEDIIEKIYEIHGTTIIIRPHPSEKNINEYRKILSSYGREFEIKEENGKPGLYGALASSDLVIGFESTAEIEAMMLGKPVITIDVIRESGNFDYKKAALHFRYGCSDLLKSADIRSQLFDKKTISKYRKLREKYISKNFHAIDGKASERIANILNKR